MAKRIKKEKRKSTLSKGYPVEYLIPVIAVLSFIPLLIYFYEYRTGFERYSHIQAPEVAFDFFLHIKMLWLYIIYACIIFLTIYMVFSEQIRPIWDKIFIPLFLYAGLCLISAFTSIDIKFSFSGIYEQFESVWMLLGYVLLVWYACFSVNTESALRRLLPCFYAGVSLMALLGIFQALGYDPYYNETIQRLFIRDSSWIGKFRSVFESGRTYLSLYNPNYVGFYVVLIVPVLFSLFLQTEKVIFKVFHILLIAVQIFILFASQSRAGILVLAGTLLLMFFCMKNYFLKNLLPVVSVLVLAVVAFIGINLLNENVLINRMISMFQVKETNQDLESIVTGKDVTFTYKENELHFSTNVVSEKKEASADEYDAMFSLKDGEGKEVSYIEDDINSYRITDKRFPFSFGETDVDSEGFLGFWVETPKVSLIDGREVKEKKRWYFTNSMKENDSTYYVVGINTAKIFHLRKHKEGIAFLEEHSAIANMRGFIWARTIPLLKKYFLLGSGPDTFVLAFPNDDLVGLMNGGHDGEIVTKPHNMYLQIGVQTGVPSLLCFLAFFFWYIGSSFRLYRKRDFTAFLPKMGVGILASVAGYLILGLTNDSCIAIAPVFYVLTGIGLGINHRVKQEFVDIKRGND